VAANVKRRPLAILRKIRTSAADPADQQRAHYEFWERGVRLAPLTTGKSKPEQAARTIAAAEVALQRHKVQVDAYRARVPPKVATVADPSVIEGVCRERREET
jgi:hypothetical protein